jgi:capsular exopolysaccharide synthesis family protein
MTMNNEKNNAKEKKNFSSKEVLITNASSNFQLVEAYKTLRTNLLFSMPYNKQHACRKILIVSAEAGEGKSTTSVNLAETLSETDTKVLLIDADLRKPTINKYYNIESRKGLSNILSGMNTIEECIYRKSETENLFIIPSGLLPPNPSELLSSKAMIKLLEEVDKDYDYVIIDAPPVNIVSDGVLLSSMVDGVAFVCAYASSTYPEVAKALSALKLAKANIIGVILNRVVNKKHKNKRGYNYSYKYRYKNIDAADNSRKSKEKE